MTKRSKGSIVIPANVTPWKHELRTAQVLAQAGYLVEFIEVNSGHGVKTPDIKINGILYEIKSPKPDKLSAIERNLKRATKQSGNIIIDSRRMRKLHDATIQKFLIQKLKQQKTIDHILFINRKREIIDINTLI